MYLTFNTHTFIHLTLPNLWHPSFTTTFVVFSARITSAREIISRGKTYFSVPPSTAILFISSCPFRQDPYIYPFDSAILFRRGSEKGAYSNNFLPIGNTKVFHAVPDMHMKIYCINGFTRFPDTPSIQSNPSDSVVSENLCNLQRKGDSIITLSLF